MPKEVGKVIDIREQFLTKLQIEEETVKIEELGLDVVVKGMTAKQRDDLQSSMMKPDGTMDIRGFSIRTVISCVFTPQGDQVFQEEDYDAMGQMPANVIDKLATVANGLSGTGEKAKDAAVKN